MAKLIFKGKEGGEFELITPGIYEFQIIKAVMTQDKDGNPQMQCDFEIAEGDLVGKKVPQWFGAEEKRGWVIRNLLDATNTPYDTLEEGDDNNAPTLEFDTDDLLQKFVRAELTHYDNKAKGKVYHNLGKWEASPLQAAAEGTQEQAPTPEEPKAAAKPAEAAKPAPATRVRRGTAPRSA
jgi:hypothetical protein